MLTLYTCDLFFPMSTMYVILSVLFSAMYVSYDVGVIFCHITT